MNLMTPDLLKKIQSYLAENKNYRPYQLKEWKILRNAALKRDNNECQDCKSAGKFSHAKEVHHIEDKRVRPDLFLDLGNLLCLCKDCHNKRHDRLHQNKIKFENEERW